MCTWLLVLGCSLGVRGACASPRSESAYAQEPAHQLPRCRHVPRCHQVRPAVTTATLRLPSQVLHLCALHVLRPARHLLQDPEAALLRPDPVLRPAGTGRIGHTIALLTMAILTMALLTMAILTILTMTTLTLDLLTVAILTMAMLTMAILTMATLTMAGRHEGVEL